MRAQDDAHLYHTHAVENQAPPLVDYNVFDADHALVAALRREGGAWAEDRVRDFGGLCGSERSIALGFQANRNPPLLHTHDRYGHRIDEVEFHPAWHELMQIGIEAELHALPWNDPRPGAHVARAAMNYLFHQVESGVGCPITMTFAGVPALRKQPGIAGEWVGRLTSKHYDPRFIPAEHKRGALMGMAMTEKQGGSDVRANSTRARAIAGGGPAGAYLLVGHKWFCSAPMCDAFLTLAQTDAGLSCFLVPRWLPDGTRNRLYIQRLKDKLGNRSNASSEIEYCDTWCRMVGEEGRGVPTIIEMVNHTRLDCVIGSAGLMRQALAQAMHHAAYRRAFGKRLIDHPQMQNVLADLCIESQAATMLMMRLARAYDESPMRAEQRPFARIATAVSKYWVCKRAPEVVVEALECHGGAGYVEESILPRLFREAPLNSIWEGSGNVMCLDVLRAIEREPESLDAFLAEVHGAKGGDRRLDRFVARIENELADRTQLEFRARRLVECMALALQGSLLVQHADGILADAFCASRLDGDHGHAFGTLPPSVDVQRIIKEQTGAPSACHPNQ
jgi:putative acyl-CoA dehydrogenase